MNGIMDLKAVLDRAFLPEQIKQRKGNFGNMLSYVETHSVIDRLNEAFGYKWSWEILGQELKGRQITVKGRLTVKIDGETIVKEAFGSAEIELHKGTKIPVNPLGDDFKAADSDAKKKAASLLGIGLHLYRGKAVPAQKQPQMQQDRPKNVIDVSKYQDFAKNFNKKYATAE